MKVNDIQNVVHGLDAREVLRRRAERNGPEQTEQSSGDGDKLELSLSAKITNEYSSEKLQETDQQNELTAQRAADIQARIASGDYDSSAALTALAGRIRDFYGQ